MAERNRLLRVAERDVNSSRGTGGEVVFLINAGIELAYHHLLRCRHGGTNTGRCTKSTKAVPTADSHLVPATCKHHVEQVVLVDVGKLDVVPSPCNAVAGNLIERTSTIAHVTKHVVVPNRGQHKIRLAIVVHVTRRHIAERAR